MTLAALAAGLALGAQPAVASSTATWSVSQSSHFELRHEAPMLPPGFSIGLEKIHSRLRLDLSMFAPWISKERVRLALYAGKDSYLRGEYHPPEWSNGIAFPKDRLVVVYDQASPKKLFEVIAHETTHLVFETYWAEAGGAPPQWLNEGLAMMEEGEDPLAPEKSEWFQTMALLPRLKPIPIVQFAAIRPTDLPDKERVNVWYVQAFSLVHFLYREHSRLQFANFCGRLRSGEPLDAALWEVYRYRTAADLESAWRAWLALPETVERERRYLRRTLAEEQEDAGRRSGRLAPAGGRLSPVGFSDFDFHSVDGR